MTTTYVSLLTGDVMLQVFGALLLVLIFAGVFSFVFVLSEIGDDNNG